MPAEVKAVEIARRRQEAGVENVRPAFRPPPARPIWHRETVMLVVGILFGEKKFMGMLWQNLQISGRVEFVSDRATTRFCFFDLG